MASFDELYGKIIRRHGITPFPTAILRYAKQLELTAEEIWLLLDLFSHRWSAQAPYPALSTLAMQRGVSRRSIQRCLHRLEQKGMLMLQARFHANGRRSTWECHLDPLFDLLERLISQEEQANSQDVNKSVDNPVHNSVDKSPTWTNLSRGPGHMCPGDLDTCVQGGPSEQASLPAPALDKSGGGPGEIDPSKKTHDEEEGLSPPCRHGDYEAAARDVCRGLDLPPVAHLNRFAAALHDYATSHGLGAEIVCHYAGIAAHSARPTGGETLFWTILSRMCNSEEEGP